MYFATNDVHVPRFPHDRFRGKNIMGLRGDAIVQFDWSVGQILDALEEMGIADNTLIILTSDNGPVVDDGYQDEAFERLNGHSPAGELRGNKYSAFEGGTRVPAIVRWPKKTQGGSDNDVLMSHIDWMASLGALIKAKMPKGAAPDSKANLGALLGSDKTDRAYVLEMAANRVISVRTKEWKYIESSDGAKFQQQTRIELGNDPKPQLYNLGNEVNEQTNLAEKYPDIVYEMQNILRRERK